MKKTIFSILILSAAITAFLTTYEYRAEQVQKYSNYTFTDDEFRLLQDGDIILRHGYGLVSDIIVETLQEEYEISHCAIITIEGNRYRIIHSVSQSISDYDGVQDQALRPFINQSHKNSAIIVRFKSPYKDAGARISRRAKYYLDQQVPFDHSFDITDDKELYCSELIWKIIMDEFEIDIFPDRSPETKKYLNFDNFYNSEFFEVILNHHDRNKIHQLRK